MDFRALKRTGPERQNAGTHGPIHHVPYLSSFFLSTAVCTSCCQAADIFPANSFFPFLLCLFCRLHFLLSGCGYFSCKLIFSNFPLLVLFCALMLHGELTVGDVVLKKVHFQNSPSATRRHHYERQRGKSFNLSSRNGTFLAYGVGQ